MKREKKIFPLLILLLVLFLWVVSAILIRKYIPIESDRGTFGDMFGAVNALFSGLALFGVVYTIYLQQAQISAANYEFRYNRLMNFILMQSEYFNKTLNHYQFYVNTSHPDSAGTLENFDKGMQYYTEIKSNSEILKLFISKNKRSITNVNTTLYDCIEFVKHLINNENLYEPDKKLFKKLFSRNINYNIIDFVELSVENLKQSKREIETAGIDYRKNEEKLLNVTSSRLEIILEFLDFGTK